MSTEKLLRELRWLVQHDCCREGLVAVLNAGSIVEAYRRTGDITHVLWFDNKVHVMSAPERTELDRLFPRVERKEGKGSWKEYPSGALAWIKAIVPPERLEAHLSSIASIAPILAPVAPATTCATCGRCPTCGF